MQFSTYTYTKDRFDINAECGGISAKLIYNQNGFVVMNLETDEAEFGFLAEEIRQFTKFFSYLDDLAALHPSPSWPREVETVWREYVAWQRSLKNDE